MLSVPDDLIHDYPSIITPEVVLVDYRASKPMLAERVLITQPTLLFVQSGTKQLSMGGGHLIVHSGNLVALRSGVQIMSEFNGSGGRYSSLIISLSRSLIGELSSPHQDRGLLGPDAVMVQPDSWLTEMLAEFANQISSRDGNYDIDYQIRALLVQALTHSPFCDIICAGLSRWKAGPSARVKEIVERHSCDTIGIKGYASMCEMSISSFKRHFIDVYGCPPGRWLSARRLKYAAKLLNKTELAIGQVAANCGYLDGSAFTRAFRRHFKITPLEYRRLLRSDEAASELSVK